MWKHSKVNRNVNFVLLSFPQKLILVSNFRRFTPLKLLKPIHYKYDLKSFSEEKYIDDIFDESDLLPEKLEIEDEYKQFFGTYHIFTLLYIISH
jgi:hypothetical protein